MATVNDLLHVQTFTIQLLGAGVRQPTVSEVSDQAEAHTLLPFLIGLGRDAGIDVSLLDHLEATDRAEGIRHSLASAANAIDAERKYGFADDADLGLLTLLWWVVDSIPEEARRIDNGH